MRKTTKAEKIAAYDGLVTYKDATSTLHYLMAFRDRELDVEHGYDDPNGAYCPVHDERRCPTCSPRPERAFVRVQGWGLGRADGGYVLVSGWTVDTDGDVVGEHVIYAGYLTSMPDGGERYYMTATGLALHAARSSAVRAQRDALTGVTA